MTKLYIRKNIFGTYYYKDPTYIIFHREDGPAIEKVNGEKHWYFNGLPHREDGPAFEYANGCKLWYVHGLMHRKDGPAAEYVGGHKGWYLNNKKYSESEYYIAIGRKNLTIFI